ncbi:hypothetical protein [Dietzia kunjamensis]|uniref:hypothetical protein n=1 Tax=Dietzia kunjamensis TaxID=322509 RepID=UPI0039BC7CFF
MTFLVAITAPCSSICSIVTRYPPPVAGATAVTRCSGEMVSRPVAAAWARYVLSSDFLPALLP